MLINVIHAVLEIIMLYFCILCIGTSLVVKNQSLLIKHHFVPNLLMMIFVENNGGNLVLE